MKIISPEYRYQHLGSVYRLIEQFELISRTDLSKLTGFAPASMTMLTKLLIDHQFIIERTSQNLAARGRPAVGLALSPFYWSIICITISPSKLSLSLCNLSGTALKQKDYLINSNNLQALESFIHNSVQEFLNYCSLDIKKLLAVSVCVIGKLDSEKRDIITLGSTRVICRLQQLLTKFFSQPLFIHEHFRLWFQTESALGALISDKNVIYLQLDTDINLNVLRQGIDVAQGNMNTMNIDKMLMPESQLSRIACNLPTPLCYQLKNQIGFDTIEQLIDRYLPNTLSRIQEKIDYFCQSVEKNDSNALMILEHITDNLAYMLINLVLLFGSEKVMFNTPLLQIKPILFKQIEDKLAILLPEKQHIDLVSGQYNWDSSMIPAIAVKNALYLGELLSEHIHL